MVPAQNKGPRVTVSVMHHIKVVIGDQRMNAQPLQSMSKSLGSPKVVRKKHRRQGTPNNSPLAISHDKQKEDMGDIMKMGDIQVIPSNANKTMVGGIEDPEAVKEMQRNENGKVEGSTT